MRLPSREAVQLSRFQHSLLLPPALKLQLIDRSGWQTLPMKWSLLPGGVHSRNFSYFLRTLKSSLASTSSQDLIRPELPYPTEGIPSAYVNGLSDNYIVQFLRCSSNYPFLLS